MTQLTEEVFERIFDKRLEGLASKADLQAIELSLDKKLKAQTKELNDYTYDKTNEVLSFLTETAATRKMSPGCQSTWTSGSKSRPFHLPF